MLCNLHDYGIVSDGECPVKMRTNFGYLCWFIFFLSHLIGIIFSIKSLIKVFGESEDGRKIHWTNPKKVCLDREVGRFGGGV